MTTINKIEGSRRCPHCGATDEFIGRTERDEYKVINGKLWRPHHSEHLMTEVVYNEEAFHQGSN